MKGYKATDKDMKCLGFQFELDKWFEHQGPVMGCQSGFHFCEHPSGPWAYYSDPGTRVFEIEADDVLEKKPEPGADITRVCRRINLVREISLDGNRNSGDYNSGNCNSGNCNSGYYNSGNCNSGDYNSGNCNSGYYNSGNCNSGNRNSGNRNSGYYNSGYYNSGNCNSGNRNSGDYNATSYSSGYFCVKEPKVISFDVQTRLSRSQFETKYPQIHELGRLLMGEASIEFAPFKKIPGITKAKLAKLHKAHLEARGKKP